MSLLKMCLSGMPILWVTSNQWKKKNSSLKCLIMVNLKKKNVAILLNEPATSMYISGRWRILCHHSRNRTTTTSVTAPPMLPIIALSVDFLDPPVAITKHLVWQYMWFLSTNVGFNIDCYVAKSPVLVVPPAHAIKWWPQFKWLPV